MSKEAMKLALEALEGLEALLLSMGLTHLIVYGGAEKAITSLSQALANEALDRMAENARELGLDYGAKSDHRMMENAQGELERIKLVQTGVGIGQRAEEAYKAAKERGWVGVSDEIAQPEQEPVFWAISYDGKTPYALWPDGDGALFDLEIRRQGGTASKMPLYTSPPAQRKPLTPLEIENLRDEHLYSVHGVIQGHEAFTRAIEAAHGIKGDA